MKTKKPLEPHVGPTPTDLEEAAFSTTKFAPFSGPPEASGQFSQLFLIVFYRDGVLSVPIWEGRQVAIGRSAPADFTIRDPSLSRLHARLEMVGGVVWIEDLESTNGTWVNGEKTTRCPLAPGLPVSFGAVSAILQFLAPGAEARIPLENHDQFLAQLAVEADRSRDSKQPLALLMARCAREKERHLLHWLPEVQGLLRGYDRMAFYHDEIVELLLPARTDNELEKLGDALIAAISGLRIGVAIFPDQVDSSEKLLAASRAALQRATPEAPVQFASRGMPRDPLVDGGSAETVISNPAMKKVYEIVDKVADLTLPVLITGETGTGKELVAHALHQRSRRRDRPFEIVNCGCIPESLIESLLFGHEQGAFTGAVRTTQGVFEAADGGTIFLDEIGELPLVSQTALLRTLETKTFTRVGGGGTITVDIRVIAATNRDLLKMCQAQKFRKDLLYRLNAVPIEIPPLRERSDEIEAMAYYFLAQICRAERREITAIDPAALALLKRYSWPGNIRELRNTIDRAAIIAQSSVITTEDLPPVIRNISEIGIDSLQAAFRRFALESPCPQELEAKSLKEQLQRAEIQIILQTLQRTGGSRKKTCEILGMPLRTLTHKIKVYGLRELLADDDTEE